MNRAQGSSSKYYSVNDRIGSVGMPVEGAEAPRSYLEGTGIRKYDKNDPSVAAMRKERAKSYAKRGIGVGLTAQASGPPKKTAREAIVDFKSGRKKSIVVGNIHTHQQMTDLVCQLTGYTMGADRYLPGKTYQLSNSTRRYSLLIEDQENGSKRIKITATGQANPKRHKPAHLDQKNSKPENISAENKRAIRRQKQQPLPQIKHNKKNNNKHTNNIRGLELISTDIKYLNSLRRQT